jgi:hypothetical protein
MKMPRSPEASVENGITVVEDKVDWDPWLPIGIGNGGEEHGSKSCRIIAAANLDELASLTAPGLILAATWVYLYPDERVVSTLRLKAASGISEGFERRGFWF